LLGGWHVCWSMLVILGWAQSFIDFIFWAHMIKPIYVVQAFNPAAAGTLIVVTAAMGYVFGYIGALAWNKMHRT
jgi:hypothetical protein